jgi:hypothetical protein
MDKYTAYMNQVQDQLEKALGHLAYSYKKILNYPEDPNELNEETLESWESFCARFARVVDVFLMRYIKARVKNEDPGFEGTLRDYLNVAEKLNLIDDPKKWLALRELRNIAAHEYTDKDLKGFLHQLKMAAPELLKLKSIFSTRGV